MIATVLRIGFINLRRDRVVQAMVFVLPVIFFSIFADVFGGQRGGTSQVTGGVVDEDRSDASRRFVAALGAEQGLRVRTTAADARSPSIASTVAGLRARGRRASSDRHPGGGGAGFGRFDAGGRRSRCWPTTPTPLRTRSSRACCRR